MLVILKLCFNSCFESSQLQLSTNPRNLRPYAIKQDAHFLTDDIVVKLGHLSINEDGLDFFFKNSNTG